MAGINLHWSTAPDGMAETLCELSQTLVGSDFYLVGGTALALLEGHRVSVDLDLFSPSFDDPDGLLSVMEKAHPEALTTLVAPRTLYLNFGGTSVSFMGYDYPMIASQLTPESRLVPFASLEDIVAMKLAAIASRGSRKDFVDLWWLATRYWSIGDCLDLFAKKFTSRDIGHVVRALTFFDDAEDEPPLRLLADINWEKVKRDFLRWVSDLMESDGG